MSSETIRQSGAPVVRDPLVPACYFDIDWLGTGHREHYDPTDPQLVVAIMPGRWINDSGAVATADRVCVALADGPNALQLDRGSGAIVADVQFNADSLPLWLVETDADHRRIVSVMDLRGVAGLPAGA